MLTNSVLQHAQNAQKVTKHVSDLGNQRNNGPSKDKNFDNPSALCLALWANEREWMNEWMNEWINFILRG